MRWVGQDLRFGARLLWSSPAFSATAILLLALGMGAATAIFSVVDAVLLKPLPFRDPQRLLVVWEKNPALNRYRMFASPGNFFEWRQQNRVFEDMAAIQDVRMNLNAGPKGPIDPEELKAERVSAALFPLLGVQPVLGRLFLPEEDQPGRTNSALLGYGLWQRRFYGDRAIVGKTIRLRDQSYTVTGVLPSGFSILDPGVEVWLPLGLNPSDTRAAAGRNLVVIARLKGAVAVEQARAAMETLGNRLEQANPALNRGWRPSLYALRTELTGDVRQPLLVLMGAVGLLLLMACANVANLLLARAASRRKEVAVRAALGASRTRIVTQLLSESVLLALAGGALGLLLARGAVALVARFGPAGIPRLAEARVDVRLFLFALGLSLLTGVLFGIAPALQSAGTKLNAALTATGRGGTMSRSGRLVRNGLVVSEVALAVLLLIGGGLLMRSFARLRAANPGFRPDGVLTFRVPLAGGRNSTGDRRIAFFQQLQERIAGLPGVHSVGAVNALPLTGLGMGATFAVDGRPAPPREQRPIGLMRSVSTGYFHTLGIPLVAGRLFAASDTALAPPVVIVSQTLARRFWPEGNPLGGKLVIDTANGRVAEIVGVVGDVKPDKMDGEDWPTIYHPYPQAAAGAMTVAVRAASPLSLAGAVGREVHQLDPEQPVAEVRPMERIMDEAVSAARFNTLLLAIFAQMAFVLAAAGIYGVISYDVTQRAHEIGIRMALGAERRHVLGLVLGQAAWLTGVGLAIGIAAAFGLTRLMAVMLYSVKPTDAYTFVIMSVWLAAVALAAAYLPSRRAMGLDPVAALRHE